MPVAISQSILIDENLNWKPQVENICKKVSQRIGILRRVKQYVSVRSLQIIYKSLVLPYFDYCSMVWGNCNQTEQQKLQKLQNRAARI